MLSLKMRDATKYQRQKLRDVNARMTQRLIQAGEITDPAVIAKNKEDIAIIEARQEKHRIASARYRERHREELRGYYKLYRNMTKGAVY